MYKIRYLITILICMSCFIHSEENKEPEYNATIWQDGDGLTVLYYYGHYYIINLTHANMCPCKID